MILFSLLVKIIIIIGLKNSDGQFSMVGNWLPHEKRDPLYKAINGLGTITRSNILRKGHLVGKNAGIYLIEDYQKTYSDEQA